MGTRAAFWLGDPRTTNRKWLGCIAWDGYPDGLPGLGSVQSRDEFCALVDMLRIREDWADPEKGGWPFPWVKDIFLTDYTYCWIDGVGLRAACFHAGLTDLATLVTDKYLEREDDPSCVNVAIDQPYDSTQPDSIIIITTR